MCRKVEPAFQAGGAAAVLSGGFYTCSGSRIGCVNLSTRARQDDTRVLWNELNVIEWALHADARFVEHVRIDHRG